MILAQLRVLLHLDAKQYAADIKKAQRETMKWGRRMERIGRRLTVGVTAPLAAMGLAGVKAASDLNEAMNKVEVVFGDAADEVKRFGAVAADSIGMSNREALEAAGTFGNLFTSMGMGRKAAADMSVSLVRLAADLASFNNMDPTVVLEKLRSGLVGEVEPLRALGVQLDQATVKAKAMAMGLADASGNISQAALVQARYALILEQTTNAQGDFARTSDSMANQMRTLRARLEDAAAALGEHLLPMAVEGVEALNALLDRFNALPAGTQKAVVGLGGVAAAAGPATTAAGRMAQVFSRLSERAAAAGGWLAFVSTQGQALAAAATSAAAQVAGVTAAAYVLYRVMRQVDSGFRDVRRAVAVHREEMVYTADTYEEYLEELRRVHEMTSSVAISQDDLRAALARGGSEAAGLIRLMGGLTREEWERQRALEAAAMAHEEVRLAMMRQQAAAQELRVAQEDLQDQLLGLVNTQEGFRARLDLLHQAIRGTLGDAYLEWTQKTAEIRQRLEEVNGQIADLESREYLTEAQQEQLQSLYKSQDDLQRELDETTEAYRRQRAELAYTIAEKLLLQAVEQGLIKDLNNSGSALDEVYTALTTLGLGLGLVDEKTANYQRQVMELTQAYIEGKLTAEQYAQAVRSLSDSLEGIPREITTRISLEISGGLPNWARPGSVSVHPQARGGDYLVRRPTLFLAGEAGPERATFTPLGRAPVETGGQAGGQTVVVQVTYAPTVSLADEVEMERVLGPFVAEKVREALAVGS